MTEVISTAPGFNPGAVGLPWWRRGWAQGAGYLLPSVGFLAIPIVYSADDDPAQLAVVVGCAVVIGAFFLGTCLVMHWPEWARWLWLLGLIASIIALAVVTDTSTIIAYLSPYITMTGALLMPWPLARTFIIAASLGTLTVALVPPDMFALIMVLTAFALAFSVALGAEQERMRRALRRAERRTAVLAVAAERERIGRDLHDILGHSLTTIAIKADLTARLIGRDDDAARTETAALAAVARQALADVRATASGMREVRLASEIAAARAVLEASGVECRTPSALPVLDDARSELFGYVVRESVTNVVRHAAASVCVIAADDASVSVRDDGSGMPPGSSGNGLTGLAERVDSAGGRLAVESSANGTTITATLGTDSRRAQASDAPTPHRNREDEPGSRRANLEARSTETGACQ